MTIATFSILTCLPMTTQLKKILIKIAIQLAFKVFLLPSKKNKKMLSFLGKYFSFESFDFFLLCCQKSIIISIHFITFLVKLICKTMLFNKKLPF